MPKKSLSLDIRLQGKIYNIYKRMVNIKDNIQPTTQKKIKSEPQKATDNNTLKNKIKDLLLDFIKNSNSNLPLTDTGNDAPFSFYCLDMASEFLDTTKYKALFDLLVTNNKSNTSLSEIEIEVLCNIYKLRKLNLDQESESYNCWEDSEESVINDLSPGLVQTKEIAVLSNFIAKKEIKKAVTTIKNKLKLLRSDGMFYKRLFCRALLQKPARKKNRFKSKLDDQTKEFLSKAYNIPYLTHLFQCLVYLLHGLKTRLCCRDDLETTECICCSQIVRSITRQVNISEKEKTRIYCRITNELIDENNPCVILPNGQLYSTKGVDSITKDDKVKCPITGNVYAYEDLDNVFI